MPDIVFETAEAWSNNWAWGLPLIVLTVLAHGFSLIVIRDSVVIALARDFAARRSRVAFAVILSATVMLLTILHTIEAAAWAVAFVELHARPDFSSAMLYSLSAMTTYGHAAIYLAEHWRLMGALEALNGTCCSGSRPRSCFGCSGAIGPTGRLFRVKPK